MKILKYNEMHNCISTFKDKCCYGYSGNDKIVIHFSFPSNKQNIRKDLFRFARWTNCSNNKYRLLSNCIGLEVFYNKNNLFDKIFIK